MKIEKLRMELEKAREKASQWQAKVEELEKKLTAQENMEILQMVHDVVSSPEELRALLEQIQIMPTQEIKEPQEAEYD